MAYDKPYRHIEGRPSVVGGKGHKGCVHTLSDNKLLTRFPDHYFFCIYWGFGDPEGDLRMNNKIKKLIKRRQARQRHIRNISSINFS